MKTACFFRRVTLLLTMAIAFRISTAGAFPPFYEDLEPHGTWLAWTAELHVWQPTLAAHRPEWRPYYHDGHWGWTGTHWQWVSEYGWGDIVFHYGRWWMAPEIGWVWIPGTVYAPAWVQWRYTGNDWGWAPMPPPSHLRLQLSFGHRSFFGGSLQLIFDLLPSHYVFVPIPSFSAMNLVSVGSCGSIIGPRFSATRTVTRGPSPHTVGTYRPARPPRSATMHLSSSSHTVVDRSATTIVNVHPAPASHRSKRPKTSQYPRRRSDAGESKGRSPRPGPSHREPAHDSFATRRAPAVTPSTAPAAEEASRPTRRTPAITSRPKPANPMTRRTPAVAPSRPAPTAPAPRRTPAVTSRPARPETSPLPTSSETESLESTRRPGRSSGRGR